MNNDYPNQVTEAHKATTAAKPKPTRGIRSSDLSHYLKENTDKRELCVFAIRNDPVYLAHFKVQCALERSP